MSDWRRKYGIIGAARCNDLRAVLVAAALAVILGAVASRAADADRTADVGNPSVVSHIPDMASQQLMPVAIIDRQDIERSGIRNLQELLYNRALYNAFGLQSAFFLGRSTGFGWGRTVILVDGRRMSSAMSTDGLNLFPVSAVERIEILGAGAGGVHGGDAFAGAINIVTRRGASGVEAQVHASRPTLGGADSEHASLLWGGGTESVHLTVGAESFRRQEIRDADRDYSRTRWTPGGSFADTEGVSVVGNTVYFPGGTEAGYLGDCSSDSGYAGPLRDPYGLEGEGCGFSVADFDWQRDRVRRETLFANADISLGEDLTAHVDARSTRERIVSRAAPPDHSLSIMPSPQLISEIRKRYPSFPENFDGTLDVDHRFVGHGNFDQLYDTTEHEFFFALQGRFDGGPAFRAYTRYHDYGFDSVDGPHIGDEIVNEIKDGHYLLDNPFSQDPNHLEAIHNTSMTKNWEWKTTRKTAGLSLGGKVPMTGESHQIRWAAGLEADREDWGDVYDYRNADNRPVSHEDLYLDGDGSSTGKRDILSAFGEILVSIGDDWDVLANARWDKHDDVGDTFSYGVTGLGRINPQFALRASWGESSRPPFLGHLHYTPFVRRPLACFSEDDCRRVTRTYGGNPELEPDRSQRFSAGVLADLDPFSLSLDWFRFSVSDLTDLLSTQRIVDFRLAGHPLPPGVSVTEQGRIVDTIVGGYSNSGEIQASGLDFRAHMTRESSLGELGLEAYWSHDIEFDYRVGGEPDVRSRPRNRLHLSTSIRRGEVTAIWNILARSGVNNDYARYGSWVSHDLVVEWSEAFGQEGLVLTGGVLNVGNREPVRNLARDDAPVLEWEATRGRTLFVGLKVVH